jgi:hypothetical protein
LKEAVKDPESGKMKDKVKGLGHWRCSGCRKVCKVTPRKPVVVTAASPVGAKIVVVDMGAVEQRVLANTVEGGDMGTGTGFIGGSCPDVISLLHCIHL